MSVEIKIEGLDKLLRDLKKAEAELPKMAKASNKELAEVVKTTAQGIAPVRSGTLRNSIRAGASYKTGIVRAGKASVPYAGVIHFGWPRHHIAPQPFLYEALDKRRTDVERKYRANLDKLVAQAGLK